MPGALEVLRPQPNPPFQAQKTIGQLSWQLGAEGKDAIKQGIPRMERVSQAAERPLVSQELRLEAQGWVPSLITSALYLSLPVSSDSS